MIPVCSNLLGPQTWLLFDMPSLYYRAYYSPRRRDHASELALGYLTADGHDFSTDVLIEAAVAGAFETVSEVQNRFRGGRVVFCFDSPTPADVRKDLFPGYKRDRAKRVKTDKDREAVKKLRAKARRLLEENLPRCGFKNVFGVPGYEADDLIAALVKESMTPLDSAVIISSDKDLYQLLSPRTVLQEKLSKPPVTAEDFKAKYGVKPSQWAAVKALAGCETDSVPGAVGVGEITACKFLRGELGPGVKFDACRRFVESEQMVRNTKLVSLPFPGLAAPTLRKDRFDREQYDLVMSLLGLPVSS